MLSGSLSLSISTNVNKNILYKRNQINKFLHSIMFYINVIDMQISKGCGIEFPVHTEDFGSWYIKNILGVLD